MYVEYSNLCEHGINLKIISMLIQFEIMWDPIRVSIEVMQIRIELQKKERRPTYSASNQTRPMARKLEKQEVTDSLE